MRGYKAPANLISFSNFNTLSYPFIGLSFLIFVCRVSYALESKATRTAAVDFYGAIVMLFLLILKFFL